MEFKSKHMVMMWISSTAFLLRQMQCFASCYYQNTLATLATDGWGAYCAKQRHQRLGILGGAIWTQDFLSVWHQHPIRPVDQVEEGKGLKIQISGYQY